MQKTSKYSVNHGNTGFRCCSLRILSDFLPGMTLAEMAWLLSPTHHIPLLKQRRTTLLMSRVHLLAGLLMVLMPVWIVVDIWVLPGPVWVDLAMYRFMAMVAFAALFFLYEPVPYLRKAYTALAGLLIIPAVFFVAGSLLVKPMVSTFVTALGFPSVLILALSLVPLTLTELMLFSLPVFLLQGFLILLAPEHGLADVLGAFWQLFLLGGMATLSGMLQLSTMIVLVRESVRDGLTGCVSRAGGEEMLHQYFARSVRENAHLAVVFLDLDQFKRINDAHGHEAGDRVIQTVATKLRHILREGDIAIRWGGEEFVLVLPNTSLSNARLVIDRLRAKGLGLRPEGAAVTASIGIAERKEHGAVTVEALVKFADERMYVAKTSGRDRVC